MLTHIVRFPFLRPRLAAIARRTGTLRSKTILQFISTPLERCAALSSSARVQRCMSSKRTGRLPAMVTSPPPTGMTSVLLIETGVGTDQHGQDVTKACIRACKDAISFNSVPNLETLVPGGRDGIILRIQLAVPFSGEPPQVPKIDLVAIESIFPYGHILPIEVTQGGARFESMCSVPALGDTSDSWVFVIAAVTIGY